MCWPWRGPRLPGGLWVLDLVGDPRAPRLRGLADSRPPARGLEEAPQPLGGSVVAATSSRALRFQTPAWSGHWLRLRLALRLVLGPQPRRPPGLRSIAASRLRPPARAHLPDCLATPPSGPRAAARPFVRPAWRAPLRTRTSPSARSLSSPPGSPSRRALPPRTAGRRFSSRGWSGARRSHPAFRPLWVLEPMVSLSILPPPVFSRSEPTRGRERG